MSYINIYKVPQYLSLPFESAFADPVDFFIWKSLFEKNANECFHINISYLKLYDQYFLINIVLYHSRNKNYKRSSVCCIWKWFVLIWSLVEWGVFTLHFMSDHLFISITYLSLSNLLYGQPNLVEKKGYLLHSYIYRVRHL